MQKQSSINQKVQTIMEIYKKQYNKEYMRLAMLKQEETFRQQVQELHRLYEVQKSLMRETKNSVLKKQSENETCSSKSSESNSNQIKIQNLNFKFEIQEEEEETDLDLTLAIGTNSTQSKKKKKEKEKDLSFTSDSGTSFSSSCNETEGPRLNFGNERVLFMNSDLGRFQNQRKLGFANENLNQAPWMYQCVNLNFT
ncbi:hypothetical protein LUZ60_006427 [Juncus effusus]|nr:hypothetical protein LUZ60_006427 [Juncus effusus]